MSDPIDAKILSELSETFKVDPKNCEYFNDVYHDQILPRIKENYLAHLIAAIEEIINEKYKRDQKKDPADPSTWNTRDFFIGLRQYTPLMGKNAEAIFFDKSACIIYKKIEKTEKIEEIKKLRIFIAHELGHVVRKYKIIGGTGLVENYANLFAFFAINGKNKFYLNDVGDLVYENESEIIRSISELCPVDEVRQTD